MPLRSLLPGLRAVRQVAQPRVLIQVTQVLQVWEATNVLDQHQTRTGWHFQSEQTEAFT